MDNNNLGRKELKYYINNIEKYKEYNKQRIIKNPDYNKIRWQKNKSWMSIQNKEYSRKYRITINNKTYNIKMIKDEKLKKVLKKIIIMRNLQRQIKEVLKNDK